VDPELTPQLRLDLVRFVCGMAWTDFKIQEAERVHILRLAERLELGEGGQEAVEAWLASPDAAGPVDPAAIPQSQRDLFFSEASKVMLVDGVLAEEEELTLELLRRLLYPEKDED